MTDREGDNAIHKHLQSPQSRKDDNKRKREVTILVSGYNVVVAMVTERLHKGEIVTSDELVAMTEQEIVEYMRARNMIAPSCDNVVNEFLGKKKSRKKKSRTKANKIRDIDNFGKYYSDVWRSMGDEDRKKFNDVVTKYRPKKRICY